MPDRQPYEYAVVQVVPRVERGERVNAGLVLICRPLTFLAARTSFEPELVRALAPGVDLGAVEARLAGLERVARGDTDAGPIATLPAGERFHWLVAPSSTVVQASASHTGLTDDPAATFERLFAELVSRGT